MLLMNGLLTELKVEKYGKPKWYQIQKYKLTQGLVYVPKCGLVITVPKGFITNFATWVKPRGRYDVAAVIHDYLYGQKTGRHYADRVFNECMRRGGCSQARINIMYYGVRLFGWWAYHVSPLLKRKK